MTFTRSAGLATLSLFLLAAIPAAGASAKSKGKRPTVRSVAPLTAGVGDQLTIKGKYFILGKKRNTVFFKATGRPAVSAKTIWSTRKTIKVVIPASVEKYMNVKSGIVQPTRFRLRILARRFGKRFTVTRLSPTIAPGGETGTGPGTGPAADCDGDLVINGVDTDDDNDLLSDALEASLGLGTCDLDSDNDGSQDGFELQSAWDLNDTGEAPPLPYPGKRPYPNPLDGTDAGTDHDGDGLSVAQEHLMWMTFGTRSLVLNYSAGMKKSVLGPLNDDFRDVDTDGLGNWDEFNGRLRPGWWTAIYDTEKPYTEPYSGTSAVDADSDGDAKLDGADDVDHDGWTNAEEVSRSDVVRGGTWRVQPFNPCLPDYNSPTCSEHPPPPDVSYPPFDAAPLPPSPIAWP